MLVPQVAKIRDHILDILIFSACGNARPLVTSKERDSNHLLSQKDAMPQLQILCFLVYRVAHVMLSVAFFLLLNLACLNPVALAADRTRPHIDPQLQRPPDIPLERLERPQRTPSASIKPIDLNRASIEQLVGLPGMSATRARQIIEGRPYRSKTDLAQRHILSDAEYDRIKNLITIE